MSMVGTHTVFRWPEFQAFMGRLGISTERICDMNISLPHDGLVTVSMTQAGLDTTENVDRSPFPPPPEQPAKGL